MDVEYNTVQIYVALNVISESEALLDSKPFDVLGLWSAENSGAFK